MKLKFDANLEYQLEAIQAATDLFEGLPPKQGQFEVSFGRDAGTFEFMTELGIANQLMLDQEQLLKNLHSVQKRNTVPKSRLLVAPGDDYQFLNFSVEMETGTGKTYVYLRNIFELNRKFGFKKFIIVVPSVAIREGVLSSIDLMRNHFKGLYDNVPFDHFVYNSKDLSKVRQFAVSNEIQIMIINIQAFKKELKFKDIGVKVLSLFFIDKVANYRWYDEEGRPQKGKMAKWFERAFQEISCKPMYQGLLSYPVEKLHDGYFSVDKKRGKVVGLKDTKGTTKADEETYELIMRDKERLLSVDEPLRFIFSHSALREGWDNPNVFQICTLREIGTERERRQTLGRGLRLPVNQEGLRVFDDNINKLTVIAGESFIDYARGLQDDIEKDIGGGFKFGRIEKIAFARLIGADTDQPIGQEASEKIWQTLVESGYLDDAGDITDKFVPEKEGFQLELQAEMEPMRAAITDEMKRYIFKNRVVNARERRTLKYNKRIELNEDFKTLWKKINKKTRFCVEFETGDLITRSVEKIGKMDPIQPVRILIDKTEVDITQAGVEGGKVLESRTEWAQRPTFLPDILTFLQRETELTRGTLVEILKQSGRLKEFTINPQAFMTETAKLISRALYELVVDGIKYERLEDQVYEMRLFQEKEIEEYLSRLYEIQSTDDRTPYDYVQYDSEIEREMAEKLDTNENVKFFCKLPRWFVVPTPMGNYNPDWAVATEKDEKVYLLRETKSTHDRDQRRDFENRKIDCGRAHFDSLGVNFKVATNIHEVLTE